KGGRRLAGGAAARGAWAAAASVVAVERVAAGAGVFRQLHAGRITAGRPFRSPCAEPGSPFIVGRSPSCSPLRLPAPTTNGRRRTANLSTLPTKRRATSP